ncbi:hypothetical protein D3C84_533360 [compost metagenome]
MRAGYTDPGGPGAYRQLIGHAVVTLAPVAALQSQAQLVAQAQRAVEVDAAAQPVFTGGVVSEVVRFQAAVHQRRGLCLDQQVSRSAPGAGTQGAPGPHARDVAEQQQAALQLLALYRCSTFQPGQRLTQDPVAGARMVLQFDLSVTALDYLDTDQPILDFLSREIGAGQQVAVLQIERADSLGGAIQLGEVEVASFEVVEQPQQLLRVEQQVAADTEALYPDPRALFGRSACGGILDPGLFRFQLLRCRQARPLAFDVAQDLPGVGYLCQDRLGKQQIHRCQGADPQVPGRGRKRSRTNLRRQALGGVGGGRLQDQGEVLEAGTAGLHAGGSAITGLGSGCGWSSPGTIVTTPGSTKEKGRFQTAAHSYATLRWLVGRRCEPRRIEERQSAANIHLPLCRPGRQAERLCRILPLYFYLTC